MPCRTLSLLLAPPILILGATPSAAAQGSAAHRLLTLPLEDPASYGLGYALDCAGDVDADGVLDLIAGSRTGCAVVYSGRSGVVLHSFSSSSTSTDYGSAVAGAGDLNGDGYGDLLVGEHGAAHNGEDSGTVWVHSGRDGALLYALSGDAMQDHFGVSVAGAGDLDGDGFDDFLVGATAPLYPIEPTDYVRVFSGGDGSELFTLHGSSQDGDRFGYSVDGAGDVDGDGWPDLLVGSPMDSAGGGSGFWTGSVQVFSGRNGKRIYRRFGDQTYGFLGQAVAHAGDMDADGVPDFLAGSWGDDSNGAGAGMVRAYSGADGSTLHTFYGEPGGSGIGTSLAGVGDVNADGHDDLALGAPYAFDGGIQTGMVRIESGLDGSRLFTWYGSAAGGQFGEAMTTLGDWNLDGHAEFAVGSPYEDHAPLLTGVSRVYSGAALSLTADDHLASVSAANTVTLELRAGAAWSGAAYLLLGSAAGTLPGTVVDGHLLPLNTPDGYFSRTLQLPNAPPLTNSLGVLDGNGSATASFTLPAGTPTAYWGATGFHAFVIYDPPTQQVLFASNAVPITVLP